MNGQNFFENKKEKDDKPKISIALQYNLMRKHQRLLHQEEELLQIKLLTRLKRMMYLFIRTASLQIRFQSLKLVI